MESVIDKGYPLVLRTRSFVIWLRRTCIIDVNAQRLNDTTNPCEANNGPKKPTAGHTHFRITSKYVVR